MKSSHLFQIFAGILLLSHAVYADEVSLFDGKSLDGWVAVEKDKHFWRVENGIITADNHGKRMPRNTFLFSEKEYDNFEFRCMFRLSGDPKTGMVNSGIQFRSEMLANGHARGYQADIGEPKWWGCIYDEHRRGLIARSDVTVLRNTLKPFGWNAYVIRAVGSRLELFINGIKTVEHIEKDATIPTSGRIALQLHSGGICRIEYKDITLKPLPPSLEAHESEETHDPATAQQDAAKDDHSSTVVFEDFEADTYGEWAVTGTAFGSGPIRTSDIPAYQGNVNAVGSRCVNSHASAAASEVGKRDADTGTLTSPPFKIEKNYIVMHVGGGSHRGGTCVNVLIDGKAIASITGSSNNAMAQKAIDVRDHRGKHAQIQIVDNVTTGWGNIGVDHILFSDTPIVETPTAAITPDGENWDPDRQRASFTVPEGFVVELVASEAHGVINPIDLTFDDAGRLWTQTAEMYPLDPHPEASWGRLQKLMDSPDIMATDERFNRVKLLYEGKSNGVDKVLIIDEPQLGPRTAKVFADGMAIPQSILPYKSGAFVAHGSQVIYLDDTDGDGVADARETILDGFGFSDSHTMSHLLVRAPGGWVHMPHGALNKGNVTAVKSGIQQRVDFAKVARFSLDGMRFDLVNSGLNNIWGYTLRASGQWYGSEANDQGLSVTPMEPGTGYKGIGGARLRPYQPWFPSLHKFRVGGTGLSGLAFGDDTTGSFPDAWRDVAFLANPITRKINAVRIHRNPNGTVSAEHLPDFLTTDDAWFRPVNIVFGPDGCLYIADFYNKIISHNEVSRTHPERDKKHGRIWRVRHEDQPRRAIPDFYAMASADLVSQLASPSLWAKRAAWHQIVDRGAQQLAPALLELCSDTTQGDVTRIVALWCLDGLKHYDADLMAALLKSKRDELRREAVRALGSLPVPAPALAGLLRGVMADPNVMVRSQILRTIAERGDADGSLVDILVSFCRPQLQGNALGGAYERSFERYLARKALELYPEALLAYLHSEAASRQPEAHITWASQTLPESARIESFLTQWESMKTRRLNDAELLMLCNMLTHKPVEQAVAAFFDGDNKDYLVDFALARQADVQSPALSRLLAQPCLGMLRSKDPKRVQRGIQAAGTLKVPGVAKDIAALLTPNAAPAVVEASIAVLQADAAKHADILKSIAGRTALPASARIGAIRAVATVDATAAQNAALALLKELGAATSGEIINGLSTSAPGSRVVLALLEASDIADDMLSDSAVERIYGFHQKDPRATRLHQAKQQARDATRAAQAKKLEHFVALARKGGGDAAMGKMLFEASCLSCHAVGDKGPGIAPPLDGSAHRDPESLLTAILNPDEAMEGNYALYRIHKRDGSVMEGYLEKRDARGATMRFMGGASLFVTASDIKKADYVAGKSFMPTGLIDSWGDEQVAALLAHIRTLK